MHIANETIIAETLIRNKHFKLLFSWHTKVNMWFDEHCLPQDSNSIDILFIKVGPVTASKVNIGKLGTLLAYIVDISSSHSIGLILPEYRVKFIDIEFACITQ